jgi:hypothetical protein
MPRNVCGRRFLGVALPGEHQKSRLVADDGDVPFARRSVLQPEHFAGTHLPRLSVGRRDREGTPQDGEKLHRRGRVIETLLQILGAPMRIESCEERARRMRLASDVDGRSRRRKVHLLQSDRHILKMGLAVRGSVKACVSEVRRIGSVLRIGGRRHCDCGKCSENQSGYGGRESHAVHWSPRANRNHNLGRSATCVRNHVGLMLSCHELVKKKQQPRPEQAEAVVCQFGFADCYFTLLIALLRSNAGCHSYRSGRPSNRLRCRN